MYSVAGRHIPSSTSPGVETGTISDFCLVQVLHFSWLSSPAGGGLSARIRNLRKYRCQNPRFKDASSYTGRREAASQLVSRDHTIARKEAPGLVSISIDLHRKRAGCSS